MSTYTENMHREEGAVEGDEGQPKVDFGEHIVHIPPVHLREPEDDTAEDSEQTSAEHDVVNMRHNVIGIVDEDVDWRVRHVDTAEPTDHKHRDESDTVQHRGRKSDGTSKHCPEPVKRLNG